MTEHDTAHAEAAAERLSAAQVPAEQPADEQPAGEQLPDEQPAGEQATVGPRRRRMGSAADMVRSMLVVLVLVGVVLVLTPRPGGQSARVVDYTAALQTARVAASYDVLAPAQLPDGWRVVQASSSQPAADVVVWHLGLQTPDGTYVTLEQSPDGSGPVTRQQTAKGQAQGSVQEGGRTWQRLAAGEDRRSLLSRTPKVTTIVTGNASWPQLETFAASLQAAPKPAQGS